MIPSVMALRVEIQRGRLVVWTLCTLLVIVSVVVVFGHGVDLTKIVFAQDSRDPDAEAKLVDHYNSYSASVVSLFGRPIEILVGLIVQVFILRFASSSLLQPETPWQIRGGVFCSAAVVAYLVNNGFNAVNAQLRQLNIRPVISASDLSLALPLRTLSRTRCCEISCCRVFGPDPLSNIDKPHVIAQVMLDESKFPSLVLQRHLVDLLDDQSTHHEVETFMIQALALEHPEDKTPIKFGQDSNSASTREATKSDSRIEDIESARSH
ncbi:hypothetical protein Poli38472_007059 [Pythium oligandrum]|uniref:Uncharacterized protein n=1 Tax=Pythium oligandrum TaxID=41045 RepID=A0A8K1C913_PYTOL|nr:hypothetical protein Poli38472_007059 [Pythium oligandrum]|eukprot:TMW58914.1 hypothetical protein Poli38472_007059 [Pythium oligandrum]